VTRRKKTSCKCLAANPQKTPEPVKESEVMAYPYDDPEEALIAEAIRNSNGPTMQGLMDMLAMGTMTVPVVGDVAGLGADALRMYQNPEERTMGNAALAGLGLLPFVPPMGATKMLKGASRQAAVDTPSGYLPNTTSNPNPMVGTRFSATQEANKLAPRQDINYDDMLGGSLMTYPTDMLSRHVNVSNISGIDLNNPFSTVGGLTYMSDLDNIRNQVGYASGKTAATSQNNRAIKAIEENIRRGGSGRVFMAPHTMPRSGENFSTSPTEGLLSILDTVNPSPELAAELSDRVRNATVKGVKGKYKDFVGIGDSGLREQLMTGAGLDVGSAGDLRKVFVDKMSSFAAEKGLGFNYQDLQNAILDPNVMNKQPFLMGDSIYEALPNLGTSVGTHPAYLFNMPGVFKGNTAGAPVSDVMGDVYNQAKIANKGKPGPRPGTFADADQLARGSLSTAGEGISLFLDETEIARLMRLFGQR